MSDQEDNYTTPPTSPRINNPVGPPPPRKDNGSCGQEMNQEDFECLRRAGIQVLGQINNPGSYGDP